MASITDRSEKVVIDGNGKKVRLRKARYGIGKRWLVLWREYPGGPQKAESFDRKHDAENFMKSIEGQQVSGTYIDPEAGKQSFASFADEWAEAQDWKATSRESWEGNRKRLLPLLGALPLSTIDRLKLQTTQRTLQQRYARNTVELTMHYAKAVMRSAYDNGRIGRDPTRGIKPPKARAGEPDGKVTREQVPTRSEVKAILAGAHPRYRVAVALGIAGLRIGEVLGMMDDRLVLESREVTVDQQVQRVGGHLVLTTPKAEKNRTIIMPSVVAVEARRHLRDHEPDGILVRSSRWQTRKSSPECAEVEGDVCACAFRRDEFYAAAWRPALKAAGLPEDRFVFHSLRHFCASSLLAEGAPLTAVAGQLGDTVDTVSRVYAHWLRDDRDVPATILDRMLAPAASAAADQAT